ncbi:tetratricopeptide repeat protein 39C-like [Harmonia axyridis]|uniref:tetratricopeptide repeat protein 39C-like n=1 Tax=Harmonia axyridis TaxID=115357 RepID=UPI001E27635B|nr:tetratricopeptide repeat protein 39C-like [Harmonia axyridis]
MASGSRDRNGDSEWLLAKDGLKLLINNKGKEAEDLFLKYPESLVMFSGYSFAVFMDALMSFEEEKLTKAITTLKEVERRCNTKGWFKIVRNKMFGSTEEEPLLTETLETQIILADSQVCLAILVFLQQDISGYLKAGWVLRKAWKLYQSTYSDLLNLYTGEIGPLNFPDPTLASRSSDSVVRNERAILSSNDTAFDLKPISNGKTSDRPLSKKVIIRLMNAVTFGYGMLQLGVSLLPPALLRLTSFLGLSGSRSHGLACLMYSRLGVDMRAPLATLSLLWYHCIVRPYYALDGTNVQAGARVAEMLIHESREEFGESALFLFFRGRLCRLNSDIPSALTAFQASVKNSTQREIKLLSLHEVGWCYLIQLDFQNSESNFAFLATWSRWSRPFYSYIACICKGSRSALGDYSVLEEMIVNIRTSVKGNQLDEFLTRRALCFPSKEDFATCSPRFWKLFVYEMLYLWNSLASCTKENLLRIISDCDLESPTEEPMKGVAKLIQGACYLILGRTLEARSILRECIESRNEITQKSQPRDGHILAFAQYELASILVETPETQEEGRKLLQQTTNLKDYDFEDRLTVRVSSLLRHG